VCIDLSLSGSGPHQPPPPPVFCFGMLASALCQAISTCAYAHTRTHARTHEGPHARSSTTHLQALEHMNAVGSQGAWLRKQHWGAQTVVLLCFCFGGAAMLVIGKYA
jgi:hypothetical protein